MSWKIWKQHTFPCQPAPIFLARWRKWTFLPNKWAGKRLFPPKTGCSRSSSLSHFYLSLPFSRPPLKVHKRQNGLRIGVKPRRCRLFRCRFVVKSLDWKEGAVGYVLSFLHILPRSRVTVAQLSCISLAWFGFLFHPLSAVIKAVNAYTRWGVVHWLFT